MLPGLLLIFLPFYLTNPYINSFLCIKRLLSITRVRLYKSLTPLRR